MSKLRPYCLYLHRLVPVLLVLTIAVGCDNKTPEATENTATGNQDLQHAWQMITCL